MIPPAEAKIEPGKQLKPLAWSVAVNFPSGRITADDRRFSDRQKALTLAWSIQGAITRERAPAIAVIAPFLDWSALFPDDLDALRSPTFQR